MGDLKKYLFVGSLAVIVDGTLMKRRNCVRSVKRQVKTRRPRMTSAGTQLTVIAALLFGMAVDVGAQHKDKPRPEAWKDLVHGGRFMDRILPAPIYNGLETDTWGADAVRPRDIHNGIEDPKWSYWGGKPVLGPDGKYHFFVCRWREDDPRGHRAWPTSVIVHAMSNRPTGPFVVKKVIGPGHFPEITPLKDGRYAIFHFHGYYIADSLQGPWKSVKEKCGFHGKTTFGSLTVRQDGSLLMLDRIMRVWIKEKGTDDFHRVIGAQTHPKIPGRWEDPLVWRTAVQYHLVINDWYGRTACHLRSKDGVRWKADPGEAYAIDFDGYEDGTKVGWYKYERMKVLQDQYGRATHMYLAVLDVPKKDDKGKDKHSSKNIALPLVVGRRLAILNDRKITADTKTIRLQIEAEKGFDPHTDVDVDSLKFGAPEKVDFGHGCKPISTKKSGKNLVVMFDAANNGFTNGNFAAKLIGKSAKGKLLFGYARLPGVDYSPYVVKR